MMNNGTGKTVWVENIFDEDIDADSRYHAYRKFINHVNSNRRKIEWWCLY